LLSSGVLLWLNNAYLPADANIKNILNVVAIHRFDSLVVKRVGGI